MLKVGVIGLGNHFLEHILEALTLTQEVEVAVICDIDEQKIKKAALYLPNAHITTEWKEVFALGVDAVLCVSFPQLHEGIIEWGIVHNMPVFVEKPPVVSSEGIEKLTKLKADYGYTKPVGVGINFNYSAMAEIVQNVINSGKLGRVVEVDICHLSNKPEGDIWNLQNPLRTMLLAQAIHPLSLMTMFMDSLGSTDMKYIVTEQGERSLLKLILPGSKNGAPIAGTIRTGNLSPRFIFHLSITFEDGSRMECTPEYIQIFDISQPEVAGTDKWATTWQAKPFLPGVEKGGYAQEISSFLAAIEDGDDAGVYSLYFFKEIYNIIDKVAARE